MTQFYFPRLFLVALSIAPSQAALSLYKSVYAVRSVMVDLNFLRHSGVLQLTLPRSRSHTCTGRLSAKYSLSRRVFIGPLQVNLQHVKRTTALLEGSLLPALHEGCGMKPELYQGNVRVAASLTGWHQEDTLMKRHAFQRKVCFLQLYWVQSSEDSRCDNHQKCTPNKFAGSNLFPLIVHRIRASMRVSAVCR